MWRWLARVGQGLALAALGATALAVWYLTEPEDGVAAPRNLAQMSAWSVATPPTFDLPSQLRGMYLSEPLQWQEMAGFPGRRCADGYLTLFYHNGDWRRLRLPLCRDTETGDQLELPFADGSYGIETGHWRVEPSGLLVVRINSCACERCAASALPNSALQQPRKALFPVIEYWSAMDGVLGPAGAPLRGPQETYRVLSKAELLDEKQFAALLTASAGASRKTEPCYIFPAYEGRFRTRAEKE